MVIVLKVMKVKCEHGMIKMARQGAEVMGYEYFLGHATGGSRIRAGFWELKLIPRMNEREREKEKYI